MKPKFALFPVLISSLAFTMVPEAKADTRYWNGSETEEAWGTAANWASTAGGAAGAVPVAADDLFFNVTGLNSNLRILMNANRSVNSLTFNSTGTTSIQGGNGAARTLTIGAGGLLINSGAGAVTLGSSTTGFGVAVRFTTDVTWTNNSSSAFTVVNSVQSSATSGTQVLTIGGSGNTVFASGVGQATGGQVSVTKTGSGTLSLNGSGAYTGVTTISGGVLEVASVANGGSSSSIGAATADSSNLVINGGTLKWTGAASTATNRGFTIGSAGATIDNTNTGSLIRFAGIVTGTGDLTKTGDGTLALSGLSDYSGRTFINGGILSLRSAEGLGASTGIADGTVISAGATLALEPGTTGGSNLDTTWAEHLTMNGGTIRNVSRSNRWDGDVALTGTNTFASGSGLTFNVAGVVSGAGGVTKTEGGSVYFTGTNTHTGVTTINAGTLRISTITNGGVAGNLGAASADAANLVFNGGTLWVSSGSEIGVDRGFTLDTDGGTIRKDSGILRMGGIVTGSGTLRKSGGGLLALSNSGNDFTGQAIVTAGTLEARTGEALGAFGSALNGTVVQTGGTLRLDPDGTSGSAANTIWNETAILSGGTLGNRRRNNTWAGGVILQADSTISADASSSLRISGVISEETGSFGFSKAGEGTVVSTALNTFTGATVVTGGVLEAAVTGGFNSSTGLSVSGGTFRLGAANVFNDAAIVTFGAGGILQTGVFSEIFGAVTVNGPGTLDLTGNGGVIRFGNSSGQVWTDLLTISGWSGLLLGGGSEQVIFGSDATGLTADQRAAVRFVDPVGLAPGLYDAAILGNGEIVPGSLIPEPSAALLAMAGSLAFGLRRRRD